jgi:hypothetical protein
MTLWIEFFKTFCNFFSYITFRIEFSPIYGLRCSFFYMTPRIGFSPNMTVRNIYFFILDTNFVSPCRVDFY